MVIFMMTVLLLVVMTQCWLLRDPLLRPRFAHQRSMIAVVAVVHRFVL